MYLQVGRNIQAESDRPTREMCIIGVRVRSTSSLSSRVGLVLVLEVPELRCEALGFGVWDICDR